MPISIPTEPVTVIYSSANSLSVTSNSFTPTSNSLIVVMCVERDPVGGVEFTDFTSTFSHTGWNIVSGTSTEYGSDNSYIVVGWCITSSSPGSGTVTATFETVNPDRLSLRVFEIASGFDLTNPIRQYKVDGQGATATSYSTNFDSVPLPTSVLLAVGCGLDSTGTPIISPGTGWTELSQDSNSTFNSNSQYTSGSNGTGMGISWDTIDQANGITMGAVEIQEPQEPIYSNRLFEANAKLIG